MVSALRQRAASPSADLAEGAARPPVVDDAVEFTTPLRASRPRPAKRRLPRWLDWRRVGLGVSIAGAMVASAIGGALLVNAKPAPAPAPATPAPDVPAVHAAASAAVHAVAAVEAAQAASAPEMAASAAEPHPASHAEAASAAASAAAAHSDHAEEARPVPPPAPALVADLTFGLDINGDGIPDSLERFVRKTISAPATRVAARHYYRVVLPLATRVQQGETLPYNEKQAVFRAAECYYRSAAEDGLPDAPNLNDRASLIGLAAADRVQALSEALQGFDYRVGGDKRSVCG